MVQIAPLPLVRGANNMKRWIYVVDDQVPVMETAVLIMRSIDPQWEVSGFKDPLTALAAVQGQGARSDSLRSTHARDAGQPTVGECPGNFAHNHPHHHVRFCGVEQTRAPHLGSSVHCQAV